MSLKNRYDFVLVFDVQDGNPNGDPDAGNLPRTDPETGHGLVTDVCLKRKIRNYVLLSNPGKARMDIYVKEKAVLGRAHVEAFKSLKIALGEETRRPLPADVAPLLADFDLPNGITIEGTEDEAMIVVAADADPKIIKDDFKTTKPPKKVKDFLNDILKGAKARRPTGEETERGRRQMCDSYFDVRTFGAVMSLKSAPNCGQVRGPVQLTFSRSIDPIVQLEHSITRMAVATEAEAEKQSGDNRTMGRKATVPYGIYVCHGFVSPAFADQTGFDDGDLALLWNALENMFESDRSAARGLMTTRKLVVFKHESPLGDAAAATLFETVRIQRKAGVEAPRSFGDYDVTIPNANSLPKGVTIERGS